MHVSVKIRVTQSAKTARGTCAYATACWQASLVVQVPRHVVRLYAPGRVPVAAPSPAEAGAEQIALRHPLGDQEQLSSPEQCARTRG